MGLKITYTRKPRMKLKKITKDDTNYLYWAISGNLWMRDKETTVQQKDRWEITPEEKHMEKLNMNIDEQVHQTKGRMFNNDELPTNFHRPKEIRGDYTPHPHAEPIPQGYIPPRGMITIPRETMEDRMEARKTNYSKFADKLHTDLSSLVNSIMKSKPSHQGTITFTKQDGNTITRQVTDTYTPEYLKFEQVVSQVPEKVHAHFNDKEFSFLLKNIYGSGFVGFDSDRTKQLAQGWLVRRFAQDEKLDAVEKSYEKMLENTTLPLTAHISPYFIDMMVKTANETYQANKDKPVPDIITKAKSAIEQDIGLTQIIESYGPKERIHHFLEPRSPDPFKDLDGEFTKNGPVGRVETAIDTFVTQYISGKAELDHFRKSYLRDASMNVKEKIQAYVLDNPLLEVRTQPDTPGYQSARKTILSKLEFVKNSYLEGLLYKKMEDALTSTTDPEEALGKLGKLFYESYRAMMQPVRGEHFDRNLAYRVKAETKTLTEQDLDTLFKDIVFLYNDYSDPEKPRKGFEDPMLEEATAACAVYKTIGQVRQVMEYEAPNRSGNLLLKAYQNLKQIFI